MGTLHSYDESISFYNVDENAKKVKCGDSTTPKDLIQSLREPLLTAQKHRELFLARQILVWLQTNVGQDRIPESSPLKPFDWMSRANAFQRLCRCSLEILCGLVSAVHGRREKCEASIKCEIIKGKVKDIKYRAGDSKNSLQDDSWVAFEADGKWHLVHPVWAIQAITDLRHRDETVLTGTGSHSNVRSGHEGRKIIILNDFWFCTAPNIFVTRCFPNALEWQHPKQNCPPFLASIEDFIALPDLRQGFHTLKLTLLSKKTCILRSNQGKCFVSILADNNVAKYVSFSYELVLHGDKSQEMKNVDFQKLVLFHIRDGNTFSFQIRLPQKGIYWFRVLGQSSLNKGEPKRKCCEFKIICEEAIKDCKMFPTSKGLSVFGPTALTEDAGLTCSSESGAKLHVKPNISAVKETLLSFKIDDEVGSDTDYDADMFGSDFIEGEQIQVSYKENIDTEKDMELRKLFVKGSVPKEGEYSLIINKVETEQNKKYTKPVVCFLLDTEKDLETDAMIKAEKKRVREQNKKQAKKIRLQQIQEAIDSVKKECKVLKEEHNITDSDIEDVVIDEELDYMKGSEWDDSLPDDGDTASPELEDGAEEETELEVPMEHRDDMLFESSADDMPFDVKATVSQTLQQFLNGNKVHEYVDSTLKENGISAHWCAIGKTLNLKVFSRNSEDVRKGIELVLSYVVERTLLLDEEGATAMGSENWREMEQDWKREHPWEALFFVNDRTVIVCATSGIVERAVQYVQTFLDKTAEYEEKVPLTEPVYRLFQQFHERELQNINKNRRTKIQLLGDKRQYILVISGTKSELLQVQLLVHQLLLKVVKEHHVISMPGIRRFIDSTRCKAILEEAEMANEVIIQLIKSSAANDVSCGIYALESTKGIDSAKRSLLENLQQQQQVFEKAYSLSTLLHSEKTFLLSQIEEKHHVRCLIGNTFINITGFESFVEAAKHEVERIFEY